MREADGRWHGISFLLRSEFCRRHGTELPRWIVAIVMPFVATLTPLRETIGRALALTNWIRLLWSAFGASHLN